jgi:dihydrodipicolinate synthase/N-acetylneuraminate lyase
VGQYSFAEIRAYYETVAAESQVPILVYHRPDVCPQMSADMALQLCSIPKVAGLKFTDYDLYALSNIRQHGAIVFNGRDEVLAAGLLMGATGGIGAFYKLFPDTFVRIYNLAMESRWTEAAALQRALNPLLREIFCFPLVPAIRVALAFSGLDCGEPIAPRCKLTSAEKGPDCIRCSPTHRSDSAFASWPTANLKLRRRSCRMARTMAVPVTSTGRGTVRNRKAPDLLSAGRRFPRGPVS